MPDLIFEWDAAKNDANFEKHGVDLKLLRPFLKARSFRL
jgi:uncharacterized DUF497 family protein